MGCAIDRRIAGTISFRLGCRRLGIIPFVIVILVDFHLTRGRLVVLGAFLFRSIGHAGQ